MRSKKHKDNKAIIYIARERISASKKQNSRRVLPREPGGVLFMSIAIAADMELRFVAGEFHQISLDKAIEVAIHDAVNVGSLEVGTMVFHSAVIEDIASNL